MHGCTPKISYYSWLWAGRTKYKRISLKFTFYHFYQLDYIFNSGANWVVSTALSQEIPYFENVLPEKLCISTYTNAANALNLVFVILFVWYKERYGPISPSVMVPFIMILAGVCCFLIAFTWQFSFNEISWPLYLANVLGKFVMLFLRKREVVF